MTFMSQTSCSLLFAQLLFPQLTPGMPGSLALMGIQDQEAQACDGRLQPGAI